jgi:RimJ/RimL family protein N-acetyltransferase
MPINKQASWVDHPTILTGNTIRLLPLEPQHFDELCELAMEPSIWTFSPTGVNGMDRNSHLTFLRECIGKRESRDFYPFAMQLKHTNKLVGFTIYHSLKPEYKTLEIGCTWLHPQYWSTGINLECKYLMLEHCFETLATMRVQLKANDNNPRSRRAIEKLGARFEGILRKDKILEDGSIRNAAYYSIIDDEWPGIKKKLHVLLNIE